MSSLFFHDRPVDSVFELIGSNENSLTFALGWCLREAPALLRTIAAALSIEAPREHESSILLQEYRDAHGFTDVEVRDPKHVAWILEAKVGFDPPGLAQLTKYANRLKLSNDADTKPLLIVLAQSDRNDVVLKRHVPIEVEGVRVAVLSWRRLMICCDEASATASLSGQEALRQFKMFVRKIL